MSFTSQKYKKYFTLDHNGPKNVRTVQTIASIGVEMMPQWINMFGKLFADKRYVLQDLPRTGVIDDVKNAICVFVKDYEHSIFTIEYEEHVCWGIVEKVLKDELDAFSPKQRMLAVHGLLGEKS